MSNNISHIRIATSNIESLQSGKPTEKTQSGNPRIKLYVGDGAKKYSIAGEKMLKPDSMFQKAARKLRGEVVLITDTGTWVKVNKNSLIKQLGLDKKDKAAFKQATSGGTEALTKFVNAKMEAEDVKIGKRKAKGQEFNRKKMYEEASEGLRRAIELLENGENTKACNTLLTVAGQFNGDPSQRKEALELLFNNGVVFIKKNKKLITALSKAIISESQDNPSHGLGECVKFLKTTRVSW